MRTSSASLPTTLRAGDTRGAMRTRRHSPWFALVIAACLVASAGLASPVHADTPPWAIGVTDAKKAEAKTFLDAGNALFLDKKYAEALEQYKSAVAAWDHPAIRFNIVRCLIQLDRPVDASDNLKLALKYGADPLEEAVYTEALSYEKLLANQIGDLRVECQQPGVKVTLDGQPLATCPAKEMRRVVPGPHQVVATKAGLMTRTVEVVVLGGRSQDVPVNLETLARGARIEHRWSTWIPWVVFGSGFAIAGVGAVVDLNAVANMDSYDRTIAQNCSMMACLETDPKIAGVRDLKSKAELRSAIGISVMVVGAATVATGAVMLYLNRGRTVYPESIEKLTPTVTPMPGGAALTLSGAF